jgi:hypothetical protein
MTGLGNFKYFCLGFTKQSRPLHILCGKLEEDEVLIITAYEPDLKEWEMDVRHRWNLNS